jgi:type II secretory pathway component GspD/PulD (secretin)
MVKQLILFLIVCLACIARAEDATSQAAADPQLVRQISRLISDLNADRAADRDSAEKKLLELAGTTTGQSDRFLLSLPKDTQQMPLAVRDRLARIRQQVEDRVAKAATGATYVTFSAKNMPLAEVISAIENQTGNPLIDKRERPDAKDNGITIELKNEPFWPALDQILDQAKLGIYSYGGKDALSIVSRDPSDGPRRGRAFYTGPFRFEVTEVQSHRSLRQPTQTSLKLQLEIGWESRLRPIAISQPAANLQATSDAGTSLAVSQPKAILDVEVPNGTQAAEITLPFELPPRNVKRITMLRGKLHALVPGRQARFRFDELAKAAGKSQRLAGVQVTVDDVRKNNEIWEIHMRLALDEDNGALQSHRAWAFQNLSYLVDKEGKRVDNAGLETTRQTKNEVGVAYLFDLPGGLNGLTWVYETPAAIIDLPVAYEIKDIELP